MNNPDEYKQWANALDEGQDDDDGYMERKYEAFQALDDDCFTIEPPQLG